MRDRNEVESIHSVPDPREPAQRTAAISGIAIADILSGPDNSLGEFFHRGEEGHRTQAVNDALLSLRAILDAVAIVDASDTAPGDLTVTRLAQIARGLVDRIRELQNAGSGQEGVNHE